MTRHAKRSATAATAIALLALAGCTQHAAAPALSPTPPSAERSDKIMGLVSYTETSKCLPGVVKDALEAVEANFGEVKITSAHRPRNGRKGSLHVTCRAADFRVDGSKRGLVAFLKGQDGIGGVKVYPNGIVHVDDGPQRTW